MKDCKMDGFYFVLLSESITDSIVKPDMSNNHFWHSTLRPKVRVARVVKSAYVRYSVLAQNFVVYAHQCKTVKTGYVQHAVTFDSGTVL